MELSKTGDCRPGFTANFIRPFCKSFCIKKSLLASGKRPPAPGTRETRNPGQTRDPRLARQQQPRPRKREHAGGGSAGRYGGSRRLSCPDARPSSAGAAPPAQSTQPLAASGVESSEAVPSATARRRSLPLRSLGTTIPPRSLRAPSPLPVAPPLLEDAAEGHRGPLVVVRVVVVRVVGARHAPGATVHIFTPAAH